MNRENFHENNSGHPVNHNNFKEKLNNGQFVTTCELGPPKGVNIEKIKTDSKLLKKSVDAVNVSDMQGSNMNLGGLAISHILLGMGVDPIYQITCSNRNRLALQSDLLSAWVLGIRNVLILTGDHPSIGDQPQSKPVFDIDSVQLLNAIKKLEEGFDMSGNLLKGNPSFFKGAAVNPEANSNSSVELQIIKMVKKIEAGAQFFQTMPIFNPGRFENFMLRLSKTGIKIPVIAGIQLLKSENTALYMNKFIPGITVPEDIIKKMAESEDKLAASMEIAANIINKIKPLCSGIHIGAQGWEMYIPELLDRIGF
jgi:methylenetetrahydrofolate reductase (NADPH)